MMAGAFELTRAKMPQLFAHAPNLFCSLPEGARSRSVLNINYSFGDASFEFWGHELLDATDLRVLQGLVALATGSCSKKKGFGVPQMMRIGAAGRKGLELTGDAVGQKIVGVEFRLKPFAQALGYRSPGAATLKRVRNSILRLSEVTVIGQRPGYAGTFHILSFGVNEKTRIMSVALNPELTAAILDEKGYLTVYMREVRKLNSDAARLLHARLHWINQDASGLIGVDTLVSYIFGDSPASVDTLRKRREKAVESLKSLRAINWTVVRKASGAYMVGRPKYARRAKTNKIGSERPAQSTSVRTWLTTPDTLRAPDAS